MLPPAASRPRTAASLLRWSLALALLFCGLAPQGSATAATYHVAPTGNDTRPCAQAQHATTPRQTINGGIACLAGGDILLIATGEYPEMLVAGVSNLAPIRAVQPNTFNIPNGLSEPQRTVIKATDGATVWLRPSQATYPGGGGVVTTVTPARWITWDGINADGLNRHGSTLNLKGDDLVYTRAEVRQSFSTCVSSQVDSRNITLSYLHVHHCGLMNPTATPQPHAMYLCGTGKIIEHNYVHHAPNRGIQLSCEQGGISDAIIRYNRIHDVNVGIQLQGHNNLTHDNIIVGAGIGIWVGGGSGGLVRNNTVYDWRQVFGDTYGILAASSGGPVLRDNIIVKQRVITSTGFNRYIHTTGSVPQMSGNLFDLAPRGGIQPAFVAPDIATLFVDAPGGDFRLAPRSPAIGVGHNGGNLGAMILESPPASEVFPVQNFRVNN